MNMQFFRKLPIPQEVKEELPITDEMAAVKRQRDEEIKEVFNGESDKFLLIIGPCSADHRDPGSLALFFVLHPGHLLFSAVF